MALEIERKFLVNSRNSEFLEFTNTQTPIEIKQGYISSTDAGVVRVRIYGNVGYITIKGKTVGITRTEFEYEIPLKDAEELLLNFCSKVLKKKRFIHPIENGLAFEIDIFHDLDLIIAELELTDENMKFTMPSWLLEDVSEDTRYFNNNLINELGID